MTVEINFSAADLRKRFVLKASEKRGPTVAFISTVEWDIMSPCFRPQFVYGPQFNVKYDRTAPVIYISSSTPGRQGSNKGKVYIKLRGVSRSSLIHVAVKRTRPRIARDELVDIINSATTTGIQTRQTAKIQSCSY